MKELDFLLYLQSHTLLISWSIFRLTFEHHSQPQQDWSVCLQQ